MNSRIHLSRARRRGILFAALGLVGAPLHFFIAPSAAQLVSAPEESGLRESKRFAGPRFFSRPRPMPRWWMRRAKRQSIHAATTPIPLPDQSLEATEASGQTRATAATVPTLTINNGSGGGQHDVGTMVTVTANPPPAGQEFTGWSGDIQILANPSLSPTTATMPSIDVTISATYADVSPGELPTLPAGIIDVSALIDCEAGTDGDTLTATMLATATKGTIGNGGSWAVTGTNMKVETSAERDTLSDFRIGSTVYVDNVNDTRGFICLDNASLNYAGFSFSPSISTSWSIGFWWRPGYTNGLDVTIDHTISGTATGNWAVLQSLNNQCWMHVGNPTSNGPPITITLNTWYWVTMKFISSGTCSLSVYNSSGILVGTSTANQTSGAGNWTYFRFGRTDNHGEATGGTLDFDDIAFDFSTAAFPLGPGSSNP